MRFLQFSFHNSFKSLTTLSHQKRSKYMYVSALYISIHALVYVIRKRQGLR